MTTEEKLKQFITNKYGSVRSFALQNDLAYSNVDSIIRRGIRNSTWFNVKSVCRALNISADDLIDGNIMPLEPVMKNFDNDLEMIVRNFKANITISDTVLLNDKPISDDDIRTLIDVIDITMELLKKRNEEQ